MSKKAEQVALIMAGGTGGHVFPALAVAEALREHGVNVHWLGTRNGIESRVVPDAGYEISYLNVQGLRGNGLTRWLLAPFKLLHATYEAIRICLRVRPRFVLGMGGFVTGPGGIASRLLARPLIVHEQNAIPGLTNKLLSKLASRVLEAFPSAFKPSSKVFYTGNPVRRSILNLAEPQQRYSQHDKGLRVLIVGGSLGAQALNETVPDAIRLLADEFDIELWHQAGRNKAEQTVQAYQAVNIPAKVVEFIDDMDAAYAWADVVICRAGAMTISELSNAGVASILVPYPYAVDDHQTANARFLSEHDAAILIQQSELTAERLASELKNLFSAGRQKILTMATRAFELAKRDATESVMQHCLEVAR